MPPSPRCEQHRLARSARAEMSFGAVEAIAAAPFLKVRAGFVGVTGAMSIVLWLVLVRTTCTSGKNRRSRRTRRSDDSKRCAGGSSLYLRAGTGEKRRWQSQARQSARETRASLFARACE